MEPRKTITLFEDVPGGETAKQEYDIPQDGTLEAVWMRNYIGHGFDLRYHVEIKGTDGRRRSVFRHLGKSFVTGDDDTHDLDIREPVEAGERLVIRAVNNEPNYLYHANARVTVDYENGQSSLLGGVL